MKRKRDERYQFYDTLEQCAIAAASVFSAKRWRWKDRGVPTLPMITRELTRLRVIASEGFEQVECGRLVYMEGRYGHEKP